MAVLLALHSLLRWLVLLSLLVSIYKAWEGINKKRVFTKLDNALRHNTATVAHIQLIVGFLVFFNSAIVKNFYSKPEISVQQVELLFFSVIHIALMFVAIVLITLGSALAKRRAEDSQKFRTMFSWFLIALLVIVVAIPWPFSPLAGRPYFRPF